MVVVKSSRNRQSRGLGRIKYELCFGLFILAWVLVWFLNVSNLITGSTVKKAALRASNSVSRLRLPPTNPPNGMKMHHKWPELSEIYDSKKLIGDPQFLLDFAIIGFQKCGTSTLMKWIGAHPQVQLWQEEVYDLYLNHTGAMVERLYTQYKPGFEYKRGYKSPVDIFHANTLHLLEDYFPKTRLIVALRHPVLYYQSFYNFRIQNLPGPNDPFPLPLEGIGDCTEAHQGVCTHGTNFAEYMYRMGKTLSMFPTETEKEIIEANPTSARKAKLTRNLVFVVEMSQFIDQDPTRKEILRDDLQSFLGLEGEDLLLEPPREKPGKGWAPEVQAIKDSRKMCICDDKYIPLREELMKLSRRTSKWIRESFLKSDDVYFSSPEFFEKSMMEWMEDPCETGEDPCKGLNVGKP